MVVRCIHCEKVSEGVTKVKGAHCPKCGTFNSLFRVEKKYLAVNEKKKAARVLEGR